MPAYLRSQAYPPQPPPNPRVARIAVRLLPRSEWRQAEAVEADCDSEDAADIAGMGGGAEQETPDDAVEDSATGAFAQEVRSQPWCLGALLPGPYHTRVLACRAVG